MMGQVEGPRTPLCIRLQQALRTLCSQGWLRVLFHEGTSGSYMPKQSKLVAHLAMAHLGCSALREPDIYPVLILLLMGLQLQSPVRQAPE